MFGTKRSATSQLDHKVANCIPRELVRYSDVTRPFALFAAEGAWLHILLKGMKLMMQKQNKAKTM